MDCIRQQKPDSETVRSMDIVKPVGDAQPKATDPQ